MFTFSKIFLIVSSPGIWLGAGLFIGVGLLWTRWHRMGRRLLTATLAFILLLMVVPLGIMGDLLLEERFPIQKDLKGPVDGIIVLGGAVDPLVTAARGQASLTHSAERMTETIALARRFPNAKIVFTGGAASLFHDEKETVTAKLFFEQMGLPKERVILEDKARNTWENAVYSKKLVSPMSDERWALVTSAWHMPRAVGVFRKVGWDVIPYPVDFYYIGWEEVSPHIDFVSAIAIFAGALREFMGLAAYRILGRTDELFPGPVKPAD